MTQRPESACNTGSTGNISHRGVGNHVGHPLSAGHPILPTDLERRAPPKLLIVYGSTEGQTRRIAGYMAEVASSRGYSVDFVDAASSYQSIDRQAYDGILVGGSVHQGQHQTSVGDFVAGHLTRLGALPGAFFSVSLNAAVNDASHQAEARSYLDSFLEASGWHPDLTACFAGAIRQAEYDYFKKLVLKLLAGQVPPEIVTAGDREYTNWAAVDRFIDRFLAEMLALERC